MREFRVPAARFFSPDIGIGDASWTRERALCAGPMDELVQRFALSGKRVLSLGAGAAVEEHELHIAGCPLTLIDIDEHRVLTPVLQSLHTQDENIVDPLIYLEPAVRTCEHYVVARRESR